MVARRRRNDVRLRHEREVDRVDLVVSELQHHLALFRLERVHRQRAHLGVVDAQAAMHAAAFDAEQDLNETMSMNWTSLGVLTTLTTSDTHPEVNARPLRVPRVTVRADVVAGNVAQLFVELLAILSRARRRGRRSGVRSLSDARLRCV